MECRIFGSQARIHTWELGGRVLRPARPQSDVDVVIRLDRLAELMAYNYQLCGNEMEWSDRLLSIFDGEEGLEWFRTLVEAEVRNRFDIPYQRSLDVSVYMPTRLIEPVWSLRLTPVGKMPPDWEWEAMLPALPRDINSPLYQERRFMTGWD